MVNMSYTVNADEETRGSNGGKQTLGPGPQKVLLYNNSFIMQIFPILEDSIIHGGSLGVGMEAEKAIRCIEKQQAGKQVS